MNFVPGLCRNLESRKQQLLANRFSGLTTPFKRMAKRTNSDEEQVVEEPGTTTVPS